MQIIELTSDCVYVSIDRFYVFYHKSLSNFHKTLPLYQLWCVDVQMGQADKATT